MQGAISDYTKVIELDPKNYSGYFNRGYIRDKSGDKQGALKNFQAIVNFSNDSDLIRWSKPMIVRIQTPIPTATTPSDFPPLNAIKIATVGDTKAKNRDYQGAIDDYNRAIALAPTYPDAYIGRGQARNGLLDQIGATEDFNRAIVLSHNNAAFYIVRGNAQFDWHEQQAAMNDFNKALALDPKKAEAYFASDYAYTRQFNRSAAIKDYKALLNMGMIFCRGAPCEYPESMRGKHEALPLQKLFVRFIH